MMRYNLCGVIRERGSIVGYLLEDRGRGTDLFDLGAWHYAKTLKFLDLVKADQVQYCVYSEATNTVGVRLTHGDVRGSLLNLRSADLSLFFERFFIELLPSFDREVIELAYRKLSLVAVGIDGVRSILGVNLVRFCILGNADLLNILKRVILLDFPQLEGVLQTNGRVLRVVVPVSEVKSLFDTGLDYLNFYFCTSFLKFCIGGHVDDGVEVASDERLRKINRLYRARFSTRGIKDLIDLFDGYNRETDF